MIGIVACGIVLGYFFLYGRPPSISVRDDHIVLSLYGFRTEVPYEALSVILEDTTRQLGQGVERITAYARVVPFRWMYWMVFAGALIIFWAITTEKGFSEKVLFGSLVFLVGGLLFVYVLHFLLRRFLSIRVIDAELRVFVNTNFLDTIDKFPFRRYQRHWITYKLGLTSELRRDDLRYLLGIFKSKLVAKNFHIDESVLRRYL